MKSFIAVITGCLLVLGASSANAMTTKEKTIDLKFIETSDVHGSFFPYDFINRNATRTINKKGVELFERL